MPLLTPQQTVRFFILGLPIGLILSGILAMIIYFRVDDVREEHSSRVPVRRPLAEADLRTYVRTLAGAIGPRHAGVPETLASASKYFQSTLGPANLGFKVSRHEFGTGDRTGYNLVLDLPGAEGPRADEIVLVTAAYDSAPGSPGANYHASGVAALMSLAQSFTGSRSARTLRFVALVNEAPPYSGTASSGSAAYSASLKTRQDKVVAIVSLEGLGFYSDTPGSQKSPPGPVEPFPDTGNFLAVIANAPAAPSLPRLAAEFATSTRLPLKTGVSAGLPALLGGAAARTFDAAGWLVFRVTDTGEWRDPAWQSAADTPEHLDYPRYLEAVKGIEALLRTLANEGPAKP